MLAHGYTHNKLNVSANWKDGATADAALLVVTYWQFLLQSRLSDSIEHYNEPPRYRGSIIVWRFGGLSQFWVPVCGFIHLSGGLRLRNYRAVPGNHKFSSRFSIFSCSCGGYSNRVKRLRRLSGNFILLKASLFNMYKGLPFRPRPSQSGLPSVSSAMWGGVGGG